MSSQPLIAKRARRALFASVFLTAPAFADCVAGTGTNSMICTPSAPASTTTATAENSIAIGSGITADIANSVYLGNDSKASQNKTNQTAGIGAEALKNSSAAGKDAKGLVTIGSVGNERRLQNVAAGLVDRESTDAVNGSQLYSIQVGVASALASSASNSVRISGVQKDLADTNKQLGKLEKTVVQNTTHITQNTTHIQAVEDKVNKGIVLAGNSGQSTTQLGETIRIQGGLDADKTASNRNTRVVVSNGVVDVQFADRPDFDAVHIRESLVINQGATVDMGQNRVQNVADGVQAHDAVNVSQLNRVADRIETVDENAAAGIAAAMATASLPQPFLPGKSMVSAAVAGYRDQQALSIGLSSISDNGRWILKSAINADTKSNFGASLGVGYQW